MVMPETRGSVVERGEPDVGLSVGVIRDRHPPGPAADLTIFDIILRVSAPGVQSDLDVLAALRADDQRIHRRGAVAEREFLVELRLELRVVCSIGFEGVAEVVGEAHE